MTSAHGRGKKRGGIRLYRRRRGVGRLRIGEPPHGGWRHFGARPRSRRQGRQPVYENAARLAPAEISASTWSFTCSFCLRSRSRSSTACAPTAWRCRCCNRRFPHRRFCYSGADRRRFRAQPTGVGAPRHSALLQFGEDGRLGLVPGPVAAPGPYARRLSLAQSSREPRRRAPRLNQPRRSAAHPPQCALNRGRPCDRAGMHPRCPADLWRQAARRSEPARWARVRGRSSIRSCACAPWRACAWSTPPLCRAFPAATPTRRRS